MLRIGDDFDSGTAGFGDIDEGIINRVAKRVRAFRTHLAIWQTRVNTAQYNLSRKNTAGNRKKLAKMIAERNAKQAQLNNETQTLRQMQAELKAQQAAEVAAANAGGGGGGGGGEAPAEEAPAEAPAEEGGEGTEGMHGGFFGY